MTHPERPSEFVFAGEAFTVVDGSAGIGVRPLTDERVPTAHVAVHRPSGAVSWGATRADAIEQVERDAERVRTPDRTGEIVKTPGVLGGKPRVAGSRIGVLHVLASYEETGSVVEAAAGFVGPLTVDEARAALEWADSHPDEIQRIREERDRTLARIRSEWERIDSADGSGSGVYRRPGSTAFAILGTDEEEP